MTARIGDGLILQLADVSIAEWTIAAVRKAAAEAAKEAGTSRLAELGLTREKGAETLRSIFEGASDAAKVSAQAAVGAARTSE